MTNFPNSTPILILTFLFLFNPPQPKHTAAATTEPPCSDSVCHIKEPLIRFPFHIQQTNKDTETSCGYPGFSVSCSETGQTLLNLPNSAEQFTIHRINYASQQLFVNDPNNCLPKRLLSLNLTGSPYDAVYYQEFTFFNCSSFNLDYLTRRYKPIACLSDDGSSSSSSSRYSVFATPSRSAVVQLSSVCDLVGTVKVPVQSPFYDQVMSSELNEDLRLSWNSPSCVRCESRGGRCGFGSNDSAVELGCFNVPPRGRFCYYCC